MVRLSATGGGRAKELNEAEISKLWVDRYAWKPSSNIYTDMIAARVTTLSGEVGMVVVVNLQWNGSR